MKTLEKVLLKDLPNRKDLIGKRINVQRQGGKYHYDYQDKPMMRVFLGARQYQDKNAGTWIEWRYVPEWEDRGHYGSGYDCGYSGVGIDGDLFNESYLEF